MDNFIPVFACAVRAISSAGQRNAPHIEPARALLRNAATIWCSGLGKSGLVARKMAGTLSSLGHRAHAVHPVDAFHGDGGGMREGDALVAVSDSGHTPETLRLARESGLPVLALTRAGSPLAHLARVLLDTAVDEEAGGAVPVTSFVVACTLADAVALALGGALHHPGGFIGAMARPVRDYMLPPPLVAAHTPVVAVIPELRLGAVLVQGGGIFTDGDLRRAVGAGRALETPVGELCTREPVTVGVEEPARVALERMERRASQISVLPVVEDGRYVGVVRLHDLVRAGMGA